MDQRYKHARWINDGIYYMIGKGYYALALISHNIHNFSSQDQRNQRACLPQPSVWARVPVLDIYLIMPPILHDIYDHPHGIRIYAQELRCTAIYVRPRECFGLGSQLRYPLFALG